ncbi:MAG: hypothetical protein QXP53_02515 [Candidatus Pacearchaeota archaeon]
MAIEKKIILCIAKEKLPAELSDEVLSTLASANRSKDGLEIKEVLKVYIYYNGKNIEVKRQIIYRDNKKKIENFTPPEAYNFYLKNYVGKCNKKI